MSESKLTLAGVQMLRAVAALMVVIDHSLLDIVSKGGVDANIQNAAHALGYIGVAMFFAISGFIMMHSFEGRFGDFRSPIAFMLNRIRRIVPLYWIVTAAYALKLGLEGRAPSVSEFIKSMFFVPFLNDAGVMRPVIAQGWTLNFEMYFYLVFAASLILKRRPATYAMTIWLVALTLFGSILGGFITIEAAFPLMIVNPIVVFFVGGVLVRYNWTTNSRFSIPYPLATICLLIAISILVLPESDWGRLLILPAILLILRLSIVISSSALRSTATRVMLILGNASYSIYLTHTVLIGGMANAWRMFSPPDFAWPSFVLISVVVCSILGHVVFTLIEAPIDRALRRHSRKSPFPQSA